MIKWQNVLAHHAVTYVADLAAEDLNGHYYGRGQMRLQFVEDDGIGVNYSRILQNAR